MHIVMMIANTTMIEAIIINHRQCRLLRASCSCDNVMMIITVLAHSQHNLRIFPNLSYFIQQEIRMSLT
jgi:hypothetical protein